MPSYNGTSGNDSISGSTSADSINGMAGNDTVRASGGNDTVYGGAGDDDLYGQNENDLIYGQDGSDWMVGGENNDTLSGGNGRDFIFGDYDDGSGIGTDRLSGGAGDDDLYGGGASDYYIFNFGTDGADYIYESSGDYDTLIINITYGDLGVTDGGAIGESLNDLLIYSQADAADGVLSHYVLVKDHFSAGKAVELISVSGSEYSWVDFYQPS